MSLLIVVLVVVVLVLVGSKGCTTSFQTWVGVWFQAAQEALYGPPGTARRVSKILREKLEDLRGRYLDLRNSKGFRDNTVSPTFVAPTS